MTISKEEAIARCVRRYDDVCLRNPLMPKDISLDQYIAANVVGVQSNGSLSAYATPGTFQLVPQGALKTKRFGS